MAAAGMKRQIETRASVRYTEWADGNTVRKAEPAERQRLIPREQVQINRERERSMNVGSVLFLTIAAVVTVAFCINFLKLQAKSTQLQKETIRLQTQLKDAQMENDTVYSEVVSSVDLEKVKEKAMTKLGMVYPTEDQIISYQQASSDYVKQYEDIPDNK